MSFSANCPGNCRQGGCLREREKPRQTICPTKTRHSGKVDNNDKRDEYIADMTSRAETLPAFVLMTFCGVRNREMFRLDWK